MTYEKLIPPDPQHAVLRKIYPWSKYDLTLILHWLYDQARKSGFIGDFDDFKLRYGAYMEATDPQDLFNLIETYKGDYHITPLGVKQILETRGKLLNQNVIVDPIPDELLAKETYNGQYRVTPLAGIAQVLRTSDKLMTNNVIVEKIPYSETSNTAGGYTVIIG